MAQNVTIEDCAICLSPLTIISQCIRILCNHIFHRWCVFQMRQANAARATARGSSNRRYRRYRHEIGGYQPISCPLCRAIIPGNICSYADIMSGLPLGDDDDLVHPEAKDNAAGSLADGDGTGTI